MSASGRRSIAWSPRHANGNSLRAVGRWSSILSNVLVRSEEQLAAVIGLQDVIVVATEDAVLVADPAATAPLLLLVERLKAQGHLGDPASAQLPALGLLSKRRPGLALPGQTHRRSSGGRPFRRSTTTAPSTGGRGMGAAEVDAQRQGRARARERIDLPADRFPMHRLANPGRIDSELIEVQTGSYLGEDDGNALEKMASCVLTMTSTDVIGY